MARARAEGAHTAFGRRARVVVRHGGRAQLRSRRPSGKILGYSRRRPMPGHFNFDAKSAWAPRAVSPNVQNTFYFLDHWPPNDKIAESFLAAAIFCRGAGASHDYQGVMAYAD